MHSKSNMKLLLLLSLALPASGCGDDESTSTPDAMPGSDAAPEAIDAAAPDAIPLLCFDESAFFKTFARGNSFGLEPGLIDPHGATPSFAPMEGAPVYVDALTPPNDGFFNLSATFIGAIGAIDWTSGWTAYPTDTPGIDLGSLPGSVIDKAGDITTNETWTRNNVYVLTGKVFVNATLTIEAGTVVRGQNGSALVITADGRIEAVGTADDPIVFTSSKDTAVAAGDWGGVVLIGKAPINVAGGTAVVEGFEQGEEASVRYGGDDAAHDCGTLQYVRIEYAGFELSQDNELNGLTVAGCGTGTTLDHVQIHRSLDDGIELFGGTADVKHLLVTFAADDGIGCDHGWVGRGQFIIVKQGENEGDKGIECDSNGDDNDAAPRSRPLLWHVTLIGSNDTAGAKTQGGIHLGHGASIEMVSSVVAYFRSFAVDVDGAASVAQAEAGDLTIRNTFFFQNAGGDDWPAGFDADVMGVENDCQAP